MNAHIEIPARLAEWGNIAGYTLTPGSRSEDGRAIFWASLGEIRLFIGWNDRGWFVVTDSDRMGPEHFILAAPSMDTIEKYFFGRFCPTIRRKRELPRLKIPVLKEQLPSNFRIDIRDFEGVERLTLVANDGSVVAVSSSDPVTGTAELAKLSFFLAAPIDEIVASCFDPYGKPLFQDLGAEH
ncbi:TNT antitoxin family protein [Mycobacterium gastri]|uniref:TNT antitoxin family protein n=1 Tax=Mycobacterium gastri TaxID=1777 RepID=UPI000A026CCD|nr:TNT antitoxin family protein [Mycobacterium gastri]